MKDIYLLSSNKVEDEKIIHLPMFEIKNINNEIDFSLYDALIFTSKNAVFSLENYSFQWKSIDSYAISKITASVLKNNNSSLVYTSSSKTGNEFANDLINKLQNKRVLYIRAKKVVSSLVDILKNNYIQCDELVSYETQCISYEAIDKPKDNSIIIFTSPSSYRCFLNSFKWNDSYLAISIGKTTASYFDSNINYKIAENNSVDECIKLAKSFTKS